jgi:hypothetical protein
MRALKSDAVASFMREVLGLRNVRESDTGNIHYSCPLAPHSPEHKFREDRNPSAAVLPRDTGPSLIHCFTCGFSAGENDLGLVKLVTAMSVYDNNMSSLIVEAKRLETPDPEKLTEWVSSMEFLDRLNLSRGDYLPEWAWTPFAGIRHRYARERGVSLQAYDRWGLGFDRAEQRLMFAVRDFAGRLVGTIGRDITGNARPKYKNSEGLDKTKWLYGEHVITDTSLPLVVVEGPLDAVVTWQYLTPSHNVVSLMGASPSEQQIDKLVRMSSRVVILSDKDATGNQMAAKLIRGCRYRVPTYLCRYYDYVASDPAELGKYAAEVVSEARLI